MASHFQDLLTVLNTSYHNNNPTQTKSEWIKARRAKFNEEQGKKNYENIMTAMKTFSSYYEYLVKLSDKMGYTLNEGVDIFQDIELRLATIIEFSGFADNDALNKLFHIEEMKEELSKILDYSSQAYVFNGDQLQNIPGQKALQELIGVQKATKGVTNLQNFLLTPQGASKFMEQLKDKKALVLMPNRDESGHFTGLNLGVNMSGRGGRTAALAILNNLAKDEFGSVIGGLPIDQQDDKAIQLLKAIIVGKEATIAGQMYDFNNLKANAGQRHEAITGALYAQYSQTGQLITGDVLEGIIKNQLLILKNGETQFNVPTGTSGAAGPDLKILFKPTQEGGSEIWAQNKNLGKSARYTYGSVEGIALVSGFFGNIGPLNQQLMQALGVDYQALNQEINTITSKIHNTMNMEIKNIFTTFNGGNNISMSMDGTEEIISTDDAIDILYEMFMSYDE